MSCHEKTKKKEVEKEVTKGGWSLSTTTSISKKRSTLTKQQDPSNNEVTRFEEKVQHIPKGIH